MAGMKHLHLLLNAPPNSANLPPHLKAILARGTFEATQPAHSPSAALCRLFASTPIALGPCMLAADGHDPGADLCWRADPVHLSPGLHHLVLMDSRAFQLDASEAEALLSTLNRHFAGEFEFLAPHPSRWYARAQAALQVTTPPLDQVADAILTPDLISGPDAGLLQRHGTEIQMLLHNHPINEAREARGELPINGVWFWGGGRYSPLSSDWACLLANDFTATALAQAAGLARQALPTGFTASALPEGSTLAVLDSEYLATPERVRQTDQAWFAPLMSALQRGALDTLSLEWTGPGGRTLRLDRRAAWKIWRRGLANAFTKQG